MIEKVLGSIAGLVLSALILAAIFPLAFARVRMDSVYNQWNTLQEFEGTQTLRDFLYALDWIDERVDAHDLDYILVLTQQCSSEFFDNVPPALALAVISVESGFRPECQSHKGAEGLMQVVPRWHQERVEKYIYDESVDLYDPRLNIMVGMDYLSDILEETEGDLVWTLMYYNGGPSYAYKNHVERGRSSSYAEEVIYRMRVIQDILDGGDRSGEEDTGSGSSRAREAYDPTRS